MSDPYFFGYGSLVNRATHVYADAHPASVRGWRRAWRHSALRPACFLTAVRDPGSIIEGLIAAVPGGDWAALDVREETYDRLPVSHAVEHGLDRPLDIAIYAIPDSATRGASRDHPILLSYLDAVIQGFVREYGPPGAARFFETTDGWDAPLLDDRAAPRYPRAQTLSDAERGLVDAHLARLPVRRLGAAGARR